LPASSGYVPPGKNFPFEKRKLTSVPSQAGSCFLCFVYTFFRLPEPRGRTFAELDVLFEHGIAARKFEKTHVDVWQEEVDGHGVMNSYQEKVAADHVTEKA
jgi:MFS transporter, SP family, general alpha glucoside:H+ symporter